MHACGTVVEALVFTGVDLPAVGAGFSVWEQDLAKERLVFFRYADFRKIGTLAYRGCGVATARSGFLAVAYRAGRGAIAAVLASNGFLRLRCLMGTFIGTTVVALTLGIDAVLTGDTVGVGATAGSDPGGGVFGAGF